MTKETRPLPYSGFTIIEIGSMVAGPAAGQILADLGADVIKIEAIDGDVMRTIPPFRNGFSGAFAQWNRNKRSILADLRSEEGRDIARKLIAKADLLYSNFRPGVLESMGMSYEALKLINPDLIYLSINGYGDSGPYADQPAYDLAVQGLVGFMPIQGDDGPPQPIRNVVVDKVTAYSAAMAMMAALMQRVRHGGGGQKVNVNMLDSFANFMLPDPMYEYSFPEDGRPEETVNNLYQTLQTSDGYVIGLVGRDSHFKGFMEALNRHDLASDGRFSTTMLRFMHTKDLMRLVQPQVIKMTKGEFLVLMRKYQVPFGPVNTIDDFLDDPQVLHNRTYIDTNHPSVGIVRTMNGFARFEESPARTDGLSPEAGQHTDALLGGIGLSDQEIEGLRARKSVA